MADRFYGVEFGGDKVAVTQGGTTTASLDVEVRVTYDATNNSKQATIEALDHIKARIIEGNWPPV